jgi:lipooligosaccharide transport system ATP-binding protein
MNGAAPLQVVKLAKHYRAQSGEPVKALHELSFEIRDGECFGLLGPNGAGKSSAIHCISGLYPPTAGKVLICGIDVQREPKRARRFLGLCDQDETLDSDFRALDQLVRYATFFRIPVEEGRRRAGALLERFRLSDKANEQVEALSGGLKRRLQVARALISQPRVLVLDEPTTGLDPEIRRELWEILMEERAKGTAILLCTHYMDEAERLCDRVGIVDRGRLLDTNAPHALIERHIGLDEVEEQIRPGVVWRRRANLEDVFLKLTGSKLGAEAGA